MIAVIFWIGIGANRPGYIDPNKIQALSNYEGKCGVYLLGTNSSIFVTESCESLLKRIKEKP